MSWYIELLENTAEVPLDKRGEIAVFILKNANAYWAIEPQSEQSAIEHVFWRADQPTLVGFDGDDMEHMDYLTSNTAICEKMASIGVTGRILFGSLEGDNKNTFWGVEFASGHYRKLSATTADIQWNIGTSFPGK